MLKRMDNQMNDQMTAEEAYRITPDTPVGFELIGVKKKAAIQLMGSRLWGRFNPNHWDPVYADETGLDAPIQTGEMSSAYIAEMCVNYLGAAMFKGARFNCKYVASILANEIIETGGRVTAKEPDGDGYRFTLEVWAKNDAGQLKSIGSVEATVGA